MVLIVFQNNHYSSAMANIYKRVYQLGCGGFCRYICQKALGHNDTNLMKASVHPENFIYMYDLPKIFMHTEHIDTHICVL